MKTEEKRQNYCTSILNCLKLNKNILLSSLLVMLVGIFLLPNQVWGSTIAEDKIIELTNKEREKAGFSKLYFNTQLERAAQNKAEDLFVAQIFEHNINGKKFSAWAREIGYDYSYIGENLAIDFVTSEGVISAWIDSPDHKKNLLNPNYKEIGVAIKQGKFEGIETILVVQYFGARSEELIPLKILMRNEKLKPGRVLSASQYYQNKNIISGTILSLNKKISEKADIILTIFSFILASFITYFYILIISWIIGLILYNKKLKNN